MLQGSNYNNYLQGGAIPSLQGGAMPSLQGSSPNLQYQQPTVAPKAASPSATSSVTSSPSAQKYINDLSSRYGLNSGTVYDKSTNTGLNLDQFKASSGIANPDWNSLKFDTAYQPLSFGGQQQQAPSSYSPPSSAYTPPVSTSPKSAYLDFLRKQFTSKETEAAAKNVMELNKRTNEELMRAREAEDRIRKNEIGQVESGLNYSLSENARLSNKSLADLALAKGYATEVYNQMINAGATVYEAEKEAQRYQQAYGAQILSQTAPALLSQLETYKTQAEKDAFIRQKATELGVSIDQINSALQNQIASKNKPFTLSEGEAVYDPATGEFVIKNPKTYSPNEGGAGGLTPYQLLSYNNTIQDNMRQDPAIKAFGELINAGVPQVIQSTTTNPQSVSDTLLMRTLAKVTDPSTGVREEEYRTFENAQGAINRVFTLPKSWVGRGRLTDQGRAAMLSEIQNRFNALQTNYNAAYNYYNSQLGQIGGTPPPLYGNQGSSTNNPDDFINDVLGFGSSGGFNSVGNTSASTGKTPYLSTLGSITGLNGSSLWKWGLDIDLKVGQPVRTPVSGTVIAVAPNGGFGNQVKLRAPDGTEYWFSHLQKGLVKVGQKITKGSVIALGGNTGNVIPGKGGDGSHLDLTAKDRTGKYIPAATIAKMLKQIYV